MGLEQECKKQVENGKILLESSLFPLRINNVDVILP